MSTTLQRLGIQTTEFSRDRQNESLTQISQIKLEVTILRENEFFSLDYLENKMDLVEIKSYSELMGKRKTVLELEQWQYCENSLYLFQKHSPFRNFLIQILQTQLIEYLNLLFVLINVATIALYNYSYRIDHENKNYHDQNKLQINVELLCGIYFSVEAILSIIVYGLILHPKSYLRNIWNFINFISIISCWSILGHESSVFIQTLRILRILRVVRLYQEISFVKQQSEALLGSLTRIGEVLVPIFFVMMFYSIVGLHMFQGVTEIRCFTTHEPEEGKWELVEGIENICGSWQCPVDTYCGIPFDHGLERDYHATNNIEFQYNFRRFDTIFYSILVIFNLLGMMDIIDTINQFWKSMDTKAAGIYFVSCIFLLGYVLRELFLATLYQSFTEQQSIRENQKKKHEQIITNQQQQQQQQQVTNHNHNDHDLVMNRLNELKNQQDHSDINRKHKPVQLKFKSSKKQLSKQGQKNQSKVSLGKLTKLKGISQYIANSFEFKFLTCSMIVACSICLIYDYPGMPKSTVRELLAADFFFIIVFFVESLIQISSKGIVYYRQPVHFLDGLTIVSQLLLLINLFINNENLVYCDKKYVIVIKSAKIIRLIYVLYISRILYTITILTRCIVNTLIKLRYLLFMWFCIILLVALFGMEMLSYKTRIDEETDQIAEDPSSHTAVSPESNYDELKYAFQSSLLIFYNEEWQYSMFSFARTTNLSFLFHIVAVCIQLVWMRLLMALFLSEFVTQMKYYQLELKQVKVQKIIKKFKKLYKRVSSKFIKCYNGKQNKIQNHDPKDMENKSLQSSISYPKKKIIISLQSDQKDQNSELSLDTKNNNNQQSKIKNIYISFSTICKIIISTRIFMILNIVFPFISIVIIGIENPLVDPDSSEQKNLLSLESVCLAFYIIRIFIYINAYGMWKDKNSYFRSAQNIFLFLITIWELVYFLMNQQTSPLNFGIFSFRIMQLLYTSVNYSYSINYAYQCLIITLQKAWMLLVFTIVIVIIYGVFALKTLQGQFYHCDGLEESIEVQSATECMDYGGSWINGQITFDTIFSCINSFIIISTSEGWLSLLKDVEKKYNLWISIYFYILFFIGNFCLVNMLIGLVIESFKEAKLSVLNIEELDETQREWYFIKLSIVQMRPSVKSKQPKSKFRKFMYYLVKNKQMKRFWLLIIVINTIILCLFYHRQNQEMRDTLTFLNYVCLIFFVFEILFRFNAKNIKIFFSDNSNKMDVLAVFIWIINIFIQNISHNYQTKRIFQGISVSFQLARCYRIIKRYNHLEKLFQAIYAVIPKSLSIVFLMIIFLYLYTIMGMLLFAYLRPQDTLGQWDTNFQSFSNSMFTMIRVVSLETWYKQYINAANVQKPNFACVNIANYKEYQELGLNMCGNDTYATIFYFSFLVLFALLIMNLLVAQIIDSFEEHVKNEESAVSNQQLQQVVQLWRKYDPEGLGCVNFKNFWRLSSEIAIVFGINKEELENEQSKRNFLNLLKIPIYEQRLNGNILVFLFHDVILNLTRISITMKYGVYKYYYIFIILKLSLETNKQELKSKLEAQLNQYRQEINEFTETQFSSADLYTIFYILKKIRMLKLQKNSKGKSAIFDLAGIIVNKAMPNSFANDNEKNNQDSNTLLFKS